MIVMPTAEELAIDLVTAFLTERVPGVVDIEVTSWGGDVFIETPYVIAYTAAFADEPTRRFHDEWTRPAPMWADEEEE